MRLTEYGRNPNKRICYRTLCQVILKQGFKRLPHRILSLESATNPEGAAMRDNLRRYRAIRDALIQWYPGQPTGTVARHLTTLAALISGIVGSKRTQLPSVATNIPDGTKPESRVKRLSRWLDNACILEEVYFLPYVNLLLTQLA